MHEIFQPSFSSKFAQLITLLMVVPGFDGYWEWHTQE